MPRSPWRRIRVASIAAGLMAQSIRLDRIRHRQLNASHGRQDHTVLPYATPVFVKRLRRYQVQIRRSVGEGGSVVRLRAVVRSQQGRPANTLHADAAASTASHPASVTTRDPPLMRDETAGFLVLIWVWREGNCFFGRDWTEQIALKWRGKLVFWRNGMAKHQVAHVLRIHSFAAMGGRLVGWVERSDTHQLCPKQ
jgi:hypothetical protein